MTKTLWTKWRIDYIKANSKMCLREMAKELNVSEIQLLDRVVIMRRNLEI